MSEYQDRQAFTRQLLSQDAPPAHQQQHHQEVLFNKMKRYIWRGKIVGTGIYLAFFIAAFWAFHQQHRTDNVIHAIAWGAVSRHILLWFLVYALREIYRGFAEIIEEPPKENKKPKWRRDDLATTAIVILVFASSTWSLYGVFLRTDPLRAARMATGSFWATACALFVYLFSIASLLAKFWLEHKKMQLSMKAET